MKLLLSSHLYGNQRGVSHLPQAKQQRKRQVISEDMSLRSKPNLKIASWVFADPDRVNICYLTLIHADLYMYSSAMYSV